MENKLQIFQNEQFGEIRTVLIEDEPWFVGKDVALALGYSNPNDALSNHVDEEDKLQGDGVAICDPMGRKQHPVVINESGVYSLVFSSKIKKAKDFKRWVTHDVLPSIRKTGAYVHGESNLTTLTPAQLMAQQSKLLAQQADLIVDLDQRVTALTDQTAAIADQTTALTTRLDGVARAFHRSNTLGEWKVDTEMAIRAMSSSINFRGRLYCELETRSGCNLNIRLTRARNRLRKNGMTTAQANKVNKLDIICMDKNLRSIFDAIIREHQAVYAGVTEQQVIDAEFEEVV